MHAATRRTLSAVLGAFILGASAAPVAAAPEEQRSPATAGSSADGSTQGQPGPDGEPESDAGDDEASGPSISGRCGDTFTPSIPGAKAKWTLHCSKPPLIDRLTGWVEDTRMDGYAAVIHFTDGNGNPIYYPRASGWGERKEFNLKTGEAQIDGKLFLGW